MATPARDAPQARVTTPRVSIFFVPIGTFLLSIVTIFRRSFFGLNLDGGFFPDRAPAVRTRAHRSAGRSYGGGGIRTHETPCEAQRLSRPPHSTALPPLLSADWMVACVVSSCSP